MHRLGQLMGGFEEGGFGSSPSSSGEEGGDCFSINGGNSWGCNAWSSSCNASSLMGFEGFSDDVCDNVAVEVGIPSLSHDDSGIVVSAMGRRGLEGKEESRMSSLELLKLADALNTGAKLEDKVVLEEEAAKIVVGGESDDFPGMLPLRGDGLGSSPSIHIRVEVECIDNDRNCNGGEVAHIVSSRLPKEGSLVDLDGDVPREASGSCCSLISSKCMDASIGSKGYSMEGICETLSAAESEKVNFGMCNGNVTCLHYRRKEDNQLFSIQNVKKPALQYSNKEKEVDEGVPCSLVILEEERFGRPQVEQEGSCSALGLVTELSSIQNVKESALQYSNKGKEMDEGGPCSLVILEEERFGRPQVEQETSCSAQGLDTELTYCSALEGSFSGKPSQVVCCPNGSAEPDVKGDNFNTSARSTGRSNDNDCRGEADMGKTATCGPTNAFRRTNPKRGASLRSNLVDEKFNLIFRVRSDGRKCRRKLSSSSSSAKLTTKILTEVKRKKRGSDRQARLSLWGAIENLFHIIKHDDEFMNNGSQVTQTMRKSKKVRSEAGSRKRVRTLKNGLPHLSVTKRTLSSQCIMVDTQASLKNGVNHLMVNLDGHTVPGSSNRIFKFKRNWAGKKYSASVRSTQRVVQQADKDPESSLTQDTSADNLLGVCDGILTQVNLKSMQETVDNKQPSDPGTSPDSNVYHPLVNAEGSVSTNAGSGMHQNILNQELQAVDGLPSSSLAFIEPASPFLLTNETHACWNPKESKRLLKEKKGKEGKKEKKGKEGKKKKKGKKNGQGNKCPSPFSDHHAVETKLDCPVVNVGMKASLSSMCDLNQQYASNEFAKCSKPTKKHYKGGLNSEGCSVDSSLGLPDLAYFDQSLEVQKSLETSKMHLQDISKGQQSETISSSGNDKFHQLSRNAGAELHKGRSSHMNFTRSRRPFTHGKHKTNIRQSDVDCKEDILFKENGRIGFTPKITNKLSFYGGETGGETDGSNTFCEGASNNVANSVMSGLSARELYHVLLDQSLLSGQKAWALCDDCQKWRCVPEELVHVIENSKWTCKDNVDDSFADCIIPQEKTSEVINKELEISDEENCSTVQPGYWDIAPQKRTSARRATWTLIKSNLFLNRNRKTQTIDEIMVCYCKPPKDGGLGCRDECLNYVLNIECVKGTCPCGDLCSNQQFQKGKYAKFKWIKCGKKGYGLQLEEDVSCGQFLIEYVGEVLDLAAYEARLRYYASRGHKHFYFMTLNGGEVIDACGKGNLGRFINHSCDPNCRTEKWMVNGEVCIGLFAIRDIKKGEEVTFDYNYVRVFGAAAKKCVCGSAECQGYIGGDPLKSEVTVHDDSAEEDLEPVMIDEDGEIVLAMEGTNYDAFDETKVIKHDDVSIGRDCGQGNPALVEQETFVENEDAMQQSSSEPNQIAPCPRASDCIESKHIVRRPSSNIQLLQDSKLVMGNREPNQAFCGPVNDDQQLRTISEPLPTLQLSESTKHSLNIMQTDHAVHGAVLNLSSQTIQNSDSIHKNNLITYPVEESPSAARPCNFVESFCPIKVKRSKANIKSVASQKAKKVQTTINNGLIEGVEKKLNELLDGDGGISRQKDSAKWYLKLLVVTAAAGDDIKGGLSQSARDLSLILDAILKTKSRTVLVDIVNKNGLQMLHNLMKQNRDNFNRIPILRKLLKALEFLAEKQILTLEHINGSPPCRGMESFKESMLKLMKHRDSQVHTIARNFADHWIPRNFRRVEPSDRDYRQLNAKCFPHSWDQASNFKPGHDHLRSETVEIGCASAETCQPTSPSVADINREASYQQVSISASLADSNQIARRRKRKSRWDQPSLDITKPASQTSLSTKVTVSVFDISLQKSGTLREGNNSSVEASTAPDLMQQISDDDDLPPGFELPCMDDHYQTPLSMNVTREVVMGHKQEHYLPHLPVSFGMPLLLTQQLGMPEIEGKNQFDLSWRIAPAMPFKPFPPLPSYPRSTICPPHGNGKSFFRPNQLNNKRHPKYCSKVPQGGTGCRFEGGYRSKGPALDLGNLMMNVGGGCNLPDSVSSKFNLNFHQEYHT